MFMSDRVFKNLELHYIFSKIIVYTPYGDTHKRDMKAYLPGEQKVLKEEYNRIEKVRSLIESHRYAFVEMKNHFKSIKDLRGSFKRIQEDQILSTVELFEIKTFVGLLQKIYQLIESLHWEVPKELKIIPMNHLWDLLDPQKSGVNTFYIYSEYSEILTNIRNTIREVENQINIEKRKAREEIQKGLNVRIRPNGEITINKSNSEMIKIIEGCDGLVYSSETYMNITFKVKLDEKVDELLKRLDDLKMMEEAEESRVRSNLTQEIKKDIESLNFNVKAMGALDLLVAKAFLAIGMDGVKPIISDEERLEIIDGRHIKVEDALRKQGKTFTPITVDLKRGVTCITGANMGGKTISLKLVGLLSAMAQYGLFVPAKKMIFSLKDYIFFSLGDLQSTDMGLSTFGAEILEIKGIIKRAHEPGLILVDELARGTNPQEGFAISKAIMNFLKNKNTITIITTHFDGLTEDEEIHHLQVTGLAEVAYHRLREEIGDQAELGIELVHKYMDYRLRVVENKNKVPRDAINIARLMGLSEDILTEAEAYLE